METPISSIAIHTFSKMFKPRIRYFQVHSTTFRYSNKMAYATYVYLTTHVLGSISCHLFQTLDKMEPFERHFDLPSSGTFVCNIGARLAHSLKVEGKTSKAVTGPISVMIPTLDKKRTNVFCHLYTIE